MTPTATADHWLRFHHPDYVALRRAEAAQVVCDADRARFRIGADGNPVYARRPRPAISAGA
jgi:acetoin utilization protein AcuC